MQNHSKSNCMSTSHQLLVDNANNRLNDLQERFTDLQAARKEGRTSDVAVLEEQVYQSLREWKAELSGPSPASSLIGGSIGSFSDDIARLLQLCEEEDDAISALAEPAVLKPEPVVQSLRPSILPAAQEDYIVNSEPQEHEYQCKGPASAMHNTVFQ